jgi:hypothetical protein
MIKNVHVVKLNLVKLLYSYWPLAMQQILKELEIVKRMLAMVNISNHKSLKFVHLLVQYFWTSCLPNIFQ